MWMNWVNKGSVLPPPYNLIPNPKAIAHLFRKIKDKFRRSSRVGFSYEVRVTGRKRKAIKIGNNQSKFKDPFTQAIFVEQFNAKIFSC